MANHKRRRQDGPGGSGPAPGRRSLGWASDRLLQLGVELRRASLLEPTLQAVTRLSVDLTRSIQGTLRLLDESGKRLLTSARIGPSVHKRGAPAFRFGEGFIGWVAVHRRPAYTNHPASDPRFVSRTGQVWTPGAVMAVPLLSSQDCIGVLSVSKKIHAPYNDLDLRLLQLVGQLSEPRLEIARLMRLNESDPLTLLHNRRHLDDRLPQEIQAARRKNKPLAVAMLDIDHFKRVNDSHGHDVGDEILYEFAERLRHESRSTDVMVRWGGEEFLALFPDTTLVQGRRIAERILLAISDKHFNSTAGKLFLTTSAGLSMLNGKDDTTSLLRRVDRSLYTAKRRGRNRLVTDSGKTH
ncbi:MAG TPA: sensor domain-containing diguanylate cyclase [Myxococcota bacterium]|nr:sensor domain-containing diguanylate cyclase [Myxococcota bacterium]